MTWLLAVPLVVLVAAALAVAPRLTALHPAGATRHSSTLLLAVVVPTLPTLWLLGLGGIARLGVEVPFLDWCRHLLPEQASVAAVVGFTALGWASIATWRALRILLHHRRLRLTGDHRFHVIDSDDVFAYALPGRDGAVVVSRGLRRSLSADEFELVLAHEEAHVRGRHDRHLLLALVARAVVPPLAPVTRQVEHHVERWADEEAIRRTGASRRLAARTLAKVALAAPSPRPALAFGETSTRARADALLSPPLRPTRGRHAEATVLVGTVLAVALVQVHRTVWYLADLLG